MANLLKFSFSLAFFGVNRVVQPIPKGKRKKQMEGWPLGVGRTISKGNKDGSTTKLASMGGRNHPKGLTWVVEPLLGKIR
jgi:hypothetical protein